MEVMICLDITDGHSCHPFTQVTALAENGVIVKSTVGAFIIIATKMLCEE
tara:strand:- start:779 stop:928 length:150 start_codon:yes stop_codon:yes gene_type:complete